MQAPHPVDVAFAAALLVVGVAELALDDGGMYQEPAAPAAVIVGAVAMLVRSRAPLVCLGGFVLVVVVTQLAGVAAITGATVIGCLFALATVARRCADSTAVVALPATLLLATVTARWPVRPWDTVVWTIGCTVAWSAGRLLRREADRAERLAGLAQDLVAEQERRAREAVEEERARIASELHDAVAHTVSVMTVRVAGVRRHLDRDPAAAQHRDALLDVERLGREAVGELHRTVGLLRAGEPAEAPLAPLPRLSDLDRLLGRLRAAGMPVGLRVTGVPRSLPPGLDLAAYRVIQEALGNTLRHAGPTRADVHLDYGGTSLAIAVTDDGPVRVGARSAEPVGPGGHGLLGMRERVAVYGGTVEAGPADGGGFAVRATLPLPGEADG
jgi:signal transduction histidine kinase